MAVQEAIDNRAVLDWVRIRRVMQCGSRSCLATSFAVRDRFSPRCSNVAIRRQPECHSVVKEPEGSQSNQAHWCEVPLRPKSDQRQDHQCAVLSDRWDVGRYSYEGFGSTKVWTVSSSYGCSRCVQLEINSHKVGVLENQGLFKFSSAIPRFPVSPNSFLGTYSRPVIGCYFLGWSVTRLLIGCSVRTNIRWVNVNITFVNLLTVSVGIYL